MIGAFEPIDDDWHSTTGESGYESSNDHDVYFENRDEVLDRMCRDVVDRPHAIPMSRVEMREDITSYGHLYYIQIPVVYHDFREVIRRGVHKREKFRDLGYSGEFLVDTLNNFFDEIVARAMNYIVTSHDYEHDDSRLIRIIAEMDTTSTDIDGIEKPLYECDCVTSLVQAAKNINANQTRFLHLPKKFDFYHFLDVMAWAGELERSSRITPSHPFYGWSQ